MPGLVTRRAGSQARSAARAAVSSAAVRGCAEVPGEIGRPFEVICCPCGTGGTLAGLAHGLGAGQRALGFSVLKGGQFLAGDVRSLQRAAFGAPSENWAIYYDFHFGGFAKRNPVLDEFITDFEKRHALALDWVYTAKMMYGLFDLVQRGAFRPGTVAVA